MGIVWIGQSCGTRKGTEAAGVNPCRNVENGASGGHVAGWAGVEVAWCGVQLGIVGSGVSRGPL